MHKIKVETAEAREIIDVTAAVGKALREAGVMKGVCHLFVPHTTAAITINENTDPNVRRDMLQALDRIVPASGPYLHAEGNAAAHILASMIGSSAMSFVENGKLVLGAWQAIYLCEFDGPRTRTVLIKVLPG
ncbi:MAG: YjbQ family protein [Deltaproteobacteria bacterium]|nr:YjbQ family protein [Deltaproteobacteria bacterium]